MSNITESEIGSIDIPEASISIPSVTVPEVPEVESPDVSTNVGVDVPEVEETTSITGSLQGLIDAETN